MRKIAGSPEQLLFGDVLSFASMFVSRMRSEEGVFFSPTCRQSISIPSLLSSRFLRRGVIYPFDMVMTAVATSQPEDQETAYRVAMEILFPEEDKEIEHEAPLLPTTVHQNTAGVSGGDQLFFEWLRRIRVDSGLRRRLRAMAERMQVWSDSSCDYTVLTREDSGALEGEKNSSFSWGDDAELVDFEESLENLLSQGKEPAMARYDDFIMRQRRGQRKAVVILQDISASMYYGLSYSKIYAAVIMFALQKHELALAFFESDDYIVKRFFDKMPIEETIAAMLSAKTRMGTMGEHALRWARKELSRVDGRYQERECVILSDFGFDDVEKVAAEVRSLKRMDIKVVLVLPPAYIYKSSLEAFEGCKYEMVKLDAHKMDDVIDTIPLTL